MQYIHQQWPRTLLDATAILKLELCKSALLFAKTKVIFEISMFLYKISKTVLALQFSFKV